MRLYGLFSAILMMFALSACDVRGEQESQSAQADAATPTETVDDADLKLQEKLNLYTGAFNVLIVPDSGLAAYAEGYEALNVPGASPSDTLTLQTAQASYQDALDSMRQAREIDGGDATADLDQSADRLMPALETVLSQWRELEPYYASRAYRSDDMAKGKAAHEPLTAAFSAGIGELSTMADALTAIQRERGEQRIAALREAGHVAEASVLNALQKADYFVSAVSQNELDEARRLAPEFEAALEEMRGSEDQYKGPEHGKKLYPVIATTLTRVLGSWRDYEASNDEFNLNTLIKFYNSAVSSSSSLPLPD